MKIKKLLVNWSLYDEELLEPYEWKDDDDLEVLNDISIIKVDDLTMNDLLNNVIIFKQKFSDKVVIFASNHYSICIEMDRNGKLKYRSVLTYDIRIAIDEMLKNLKVTPILYTIRDYCELKEFGLTRNERIKKQYIIQKIELLYHYQPKKLIEVYRHIFSGELQDIEAIYRYLINFITIKYSFFHEYLYKILYLV